MVYSLKQDVLQGIIILAILLSILNFVGCGTQSGDTATVMVNTTEANDTGSLAPLETPESLSPPSSGTPKTETSDAASPGTPKIETSDAASPGTPEIETSANPPSTVGYTPVSYEIDASVHPEMPEYRFVAEGLTRDVADDWFFGFVMGLKVYDEKGVLMLYKDFSQTYDDQAGNAVYNEMMDTMGLHVTDVNFDGYKDIILLNSFSGAHGNTWYACWLWDPKTLGFVESPSFEDIANPALDPVKKCIYSTGGSGADNQTWDIYQFIDAEFMVTNSLSYRDTYDEKTLNNYYFTEKKLVNGVMGTVRDDVIQAAGFEDALSAAGYIGDDLWRLNDPRWYGIGGHQADKWLD